MPKTTSASTSTSVERMGRDLITPEQIAEMLAQLGAGAQGGAEQPAVPPDIQVPYQPGAQPGSAADRTQRALNEIKPGESTPPPGPSAPPAPVDLGSELTGGKTFMDFINDPKTITAAIFGLATLNSHADSLGEAFMEGLGAVGSAQAAQRKRMETEFQQRRQEEALSIEQQRLGLEEERVGLERYRAGEDVKAAGETLKLNKIRVMNEAVANSLREQGLTLEELSMKSREKIAKEANKLGYTVAYADLLGRLAAIDASLEQASAQRDATAAAREQNRVFSDIALKTELVRAMVAAAGPEAYFYAKAANPDLTQEQFAKDAVERIRRMAETFKFLPNLINPPVVDKEGKVVITPTPPKPEGQGVLSWVKEKATKAGAGVQTAAATLGEMVIGKADRPKAEPDTVKELATVNKRIAAMEGVLAGFRPDELAYKQHKQTLEQLQARKAELEKLPNTPETPATISVAPEDMARVRKAVGSEGLSIDKEGRIWKLSDDNTTFTELPPAKK